MRTPLPRTLTARLVVTAVALVALVSVLVATVSTVAMNHFLTERLDQQLQGAADRARDDPGGRAGPGGPGGPAGPGFGGRRPQSVDTLLADLTTSGGRGGFLTGDGGSDAVTERDLTTLRAVRGDEPRTVGLSEGDYRVVVGQNRSGDTIAVGLPLRDVHRSTVSLLVSSLLLALSGVCLAALLGLLLVRRQLRPLRVVAATAYDVTALPLEAGEQTIETRVDTAHTDPATEVGRVGTALNTLLDHVDDALAARHRSEQQVRQFVADASHELRTPLATIHGYAELSRRTPQDAAALVTAMGKVETEADRMASLVDDLLLLARLDAGRPLEREEVDLTRLLLEAVTDARVVAPDHHWRLDLPDEPVTVVGDERGLHQVVTNLINNARRHTPDGTTVTVGVQAAAEGVDPVTVTVHDDGPGVPPEFAATVFERFTRGDSSRTRVSGGAGLGLSMVQAIAQAHGGSASVESRPGSTTFSVVLPSFATM